MEKILGILIFYLFLFFTASSLKASEVLVYRNESMPWCGTVDGKDAGIMIDILNAVTKNGGPKFKFESVPWTRAQRLVQENKGTAIIPLTRVATREENHTWIIELVPNRARLTTARNPMRKVTIPSPLTLVNSKPLIIGIIRGSALNTSMKELGFTKLHEVNTAEQLAQMLSMGRVDAVVESKWVDNYVWSQAGLEGDDLIVGPNVGETKYIYLGAALNFPQEITNQIRKAMFEVKKSGALEKILTRWTNF